MSRNILFLAKINNDDRDCVYYVDFEGFVCNHYFSGMHLTGACFSGGEKEFRDIVDNHFDCLETILSKEDFIYLFKLQEDIKALGYGIEKFSEKYNKGIEILETYKNTLEKKLLSDDNKKLFEKVIADEKQWLINEYNFSAEDVELIFDSYACCYQDRAIVSTVYADRYELCDDMRNCYGWEDIPYFDNEAFINDLLESSGYIELSDGRIVSYSY